MRDYGSSVHPFMSCPFTLPSMKSISIDIKLMNSFLSLTIQKNLTNIYKLQKTDDTLRKPL